MKDQKFDKGEGKAKEVFISGESLFSNSGGQLEFVSMTIKWKLIGKRDEGFWHAPFAVIRFANHDVETTKTAPIKGKYYELEVPLCRE